MFLFLCPQYLSTEPIFRSPKQQHGDDEHHERHHGKRHRAHALFLFLLGRVAWQARLVELCQLLQILHFGVGKFLLTAHFLVAACLLALGVENAVEILLPRCQSLHRVGALLFLTILLHHPKVTTFPPKPHHPHPTKKTPSQDFTAHQPNAFFYRSKRFN